MKINDEPEALAALRVVARYHHIHMRGRRAVNPLVNVPTTNCHS